MSKIILTVFAFVVLLAAAEPASACSCTRTLSPRQAYESAAAVFIGTVSRAEPEPKDDRDYVGAQVVHVQIEEAFKGVAAGAEIVLRQPGDNCVPRYKSGHRALMYVHYHEATKTWEVYGCSRGGTPERVADDLLYLRALPGSASRSRISGTLEHYEDGPDQGFSHVGNIAGAKVKIVGEKETYEAVTDSNGVYELYDLPPGTYTIRPELPYGLKLRFPIPFGGQNNESALAWLDPEKRGKDVMVKLGAGDMAGVDFILSSDNRISGRVLDPQGKAIGGVCVVLLSVKTEYKPGVSLLFDCTENGGRYRLDEVPPGRYLIAANVDNRPSGTEPFHTVYYPGVFEKEKAAVVIVGSKEEADDHDLRVPRLLPTITVSGRLLYKDGHPVAGEHVSFEPNDKKYDGNGAQTDAEGRFTLKLLRGVPGQLSAKLLVYEEMFAAACPEVKKLIDATGRGTAFAETNTMKVSAAADTPGLRLVIPYSYCPLKEKEKEEN